jgi:signal transduction histidine kinase
MTAIPHKESHFNAEQRSNQAELQRQRGLFSEDQITFSLLDSVPNLLAILNRQRQIIFANQPLLELIGVDDLAHFVGRRPGEVFTCEHADESLHGCGGSEACSTCGAALALLAAEAGKAKVAECRMTRLLGGKLEALDMEVWATPLRFKEETFTVFALTDVSHQKWRSLMEKLFFHDVLNVIGTIKGFAELLQDHDPRDKDEIYTLIHLASQQVIDQVLAFRTLSAAEKRELKVNYELLSIKEFIEGVAEVYRHHDAARGRILELQLPEEMFLFSGDRMLLGRIIGNMLLNAFEATSPQQSVVLSCKRTAEEVSFSVQNPGVIPRQVQLQIFQRSFSTKGPGRGLGTYSLRLLNEYLHGQVTFESNATSGTIFTVRYPISAEN